MHAQREEHWSHIITNILHISTSRGVHLTKHLNINYLKIVSWIIHPSVCPDDPQHVAPEHPQASQPRWKGLSPPERPPCGCVGWDWPDPLALDAFHVAAFDQSPGVCPSGTTFWRCTRDVPPDDFRPRDSPLELICWWSGIYCDQLLYFQFQLTIAWRCLMLLCVKDHLASPLFTVLYCSVPSHSQRQLSWGPSKLNRVTSIIRWTMTFYQALMLPRKIKMYSW